MMMNRQQRLIMAIRAKFPGEMSAEGINYNQAAKELGVSRAALIAWIRKPDVEIKTSNWQTLARVTGYCRNWLELEEGPEKPLKYHPHSTEKPAISEELIVIESHDTRIKWSELANLLDSKQSSMEQRNMSISGATIKTLVIELESNQFAPYASAGETLIVESVTATHNMKVLARIGDEFYILIHNKLQNTFRDLNDSPIAVECDPVILGVITRIYGASRKG